MTSLQVVAGAGSQQAPLLVVQVVGPQVGVPIQVFPGVARQVSQPATRLQVAPVQQAPVAHGVVIVQSHLGLVIGAPLALQ